MGRLHCEERGLQARCHERYFVLRCPACGRPNFSYQVTPAQVRGHDDSVLLDAVQWELVGDVLKMRHGVCPSRGGRITTEVMNVPPAHAVVYHPESVSFHWDHGIDVVETEPWEFHEYLRDGRWSVDRTGTDPDEYCVELGIDAAPLGLSLDEGATVTRTERVQRREQSDRRLGWGRSDGGPVGSEPGGS